MKPNGVRTSFHLSPNGTITGTSSQYLNPPGILVSIASQSTDNLFFTFTKMYRNIFYHWTNAKANKNQHSKEEPPSMINRNTPTPCETKHSTYQFPPGLQIVPSNATLPPSELVRKNFQVMLKPFWRQFQLHKCVWNKLSLQETISHQVSFHASLCLSDLVPPGNVCAIRSE